MIRAGQMKRHLSRELTSAVDVLQSVVAHIELARLQVGVGIGVREERVPFGRDPGAVAARVVPAVAGQQRPCGRVLFQMRIVPEETILALRGEQAQHPGAVGKHQHASAVRRFQEFEFLACRLNRLSQCF